MSSEWSCLNKRVSKNLRVVHTEPPSSLVDQGEPRIQPFFSAVTPNTQHPELVQVLILESKYDVLSEEMKPRQRFEVAIRNP